MIDNYKDWQKARRMAVKQRDMHNDMVSGVWSINGKLFCEEFGLDYGMAEETEDMRSTEDFDDEYNRELNRIVSLVGKLTKEQEERLFSKMEAEFCFPKEEVYFWDNLVWQLDNLSKYEQYQELAKEEA